jgi:hypothetical protein
MARHIRKTRKFHLKKRRTIKSKRMYGGNTKEDALAVIKAKGYSKEDFITKMFKEGRKNNIMGSYGKISAYFLDMSDFTFKVQGSVTITLYAKPKNAEDDKYVEIYSISDH